ncbi:MAG TPA: cellulase family glycosylhydrolase [Polyangiaceae bacterium]|nr:cellulase family glycosylhydrolase [Polyangiaceae bacterium]
MKSCIRFSEPWRHVLLAGLSFSLLPGCLRMSNSAGAQGAGAQGAPAEAAGGSAQAKAADGLLKVDPTDTPSAVFLHQGKPFCFTGSNNYYLSYKDKPMVDDVFTQAKAMGLKVMRTWAFIDRGSIDDSVPSTDRNEWEPYGTKQGVYFQYWDTTTKSVAYNEGAEKNDGLVRLDYVLAKAAENDVKMVLVLTNNWKEFGGMNQYLKWFGLNYHHEFYTDARAKQAYKSFAAQLINRVNTVTKVAYKDDPNIFAWELANEPRCRNFGQYDRLQDCKPETITSWVKEMSEHIKSLDPNHMVAVGDEGFFNRPGQSGEQYSGKDGTDHEAFLALKSIDFGTFHLYPDAWSTGARWGNQWILDHVEAAQKAGKPTVLEEYGIPVKRDDKTGKVTGGFDRRRTAYINWNNLMLERGGNGSMFWLLVGIDPSNANTGQYQDYDHFSVYNMPDDDSAKLLVDYAAQFPTGARACELATAHGVSGPSSPFVSTMPPPPGVASSPAPLPVPLALNSFFPQSGSVE